MINILMQKRDKLNRMAHRSRRGIPTRHETFIGPETHLCNGLTEAMNILLCILGRHPKMMSGDGPFYLEH